MEFDGVRKYAVPAGLAVVALVMLTALGYLRFGSVAVSGDTAQARVDSICRLAAERPSGSAGAIAATAAHDPEPLVRKAALVALTGLAGPEARAAAEAGSCDKDPAVRAAAAELLGMFDDAAAVARLGELVSADKDEAVRMGALLGLGRSRNPRALALLVEVMETNNIPAVRQSALVTLMRQMKVEYVKPPSPADAGWAETIAQVKQIPRVRAALDKTGRS